MSFSPVLVSVISNLACNFNIKTSALLVLLLLSCINYNRAIDASDSQETIETIVFRDAHGLEHEEYAFREPIRGLPDHVLDMFCSSVKLRLYWNEYRDQMKQGNRKGLYLRRMARLARHIFEDVRDADKPFNATMLSRTDMYFNVKLDKEDEKIDKAIASRGEKDDEDQSQADADDESNGKATKALGKINSLKNMIGKKIVGKKNKLKLGGASDTKEVIEEIESSDAIKDLESSGDANASLKIKEFLKKWGPKVALGIYTRWRTMWWMMMSCLYTKYYLWDPALAEFTKLKRSLVMWPELQLTRMQDLQCKPLMFFKRLMDVCKVLNPLMNMDFGQFNLEKLTRFKSDS